MVLIKSAFWERNKIILEPWAWSLGLGPAFGITIYAMLRNVSGAVIGGVILGFIVMLAALVGGDGDA